MGDQYLEHGQLQQTSSHLMKHGFHGTWPFLAQPIFSNNSSARRRLYASIQTSSTDLYVHRLIAGSVSAPESTSSCQFCPSRLSPESGWTDIIK